MLSGGKLGQIVFASNDFKYTYPSTREQRASKIHARYRLSRKYAFFMYFYVSRHAPLFEIVLSSRIHFVHHWSTSTELHDDGNNKHG